MNILRTASCIGWLMISGGLVGCGNDSGGPVGEIGACAVESTFSSIYTNRLSTNTCARAGCHASASSAGGLDLAQPQADLHADLIDRASQARPADVLVAPGQSAQSYLFVKLTRDDVPGGRMPPGGSLDQCEIDAIAAWIDGGALEN